LDMETILLIVVIVILVGGFALIFSYFKNKDANRAPDQSLVLLQNQLQELNRTLDQKLGESTKMFQAQFGQSAKIIESVTEKLARVEETGRQVVNLGDNIRALEDVLKNPKQRGILGEYYLETLLKNVLPPGSYEMQYAFEDGTIVDAAVFVGEGKNRKVIPIDSKFSLENYNRLVEEKDPTERERLERAFKNDLKSRIDETSKYVKPSENTMDFAFMFIPHEAIYYDLLVAQVGAVKVNTQDLIEYAFKDRHVIIVSPTSFLAYLQTVLQGLRALKIEESAKEIRKNIEQLSKHLAYYDSYMQKMGGHLATTVNAYNASYKEFKKVDKDILRITGEAMEIEPLLVGGPQKEEAE